MPAVNPLTRRDLLALLLVVMIAAIMRLGEPGVVEFLHDEAYLSLLAQDMVDDGAIRLAGMPSSVGVPNPPISVYLLVIPYALNASPQFATLFIAALNVVGVGLLWFIAQRYFGRWTALAAGLVYALNPWAILYSRKIWAQDFQTPFILLALLFGLHGFIEGKRWAQVLCLPLLCIALQIHIAAWALLPLMLSLMWLGRKHFAPLTLLLSIMLAAITFIPFGLGLAQTLAQDPTRLSSAISRSEGSLSLSPAALSHTFNLITGLGVETWTTPEQTADLLAKVPRPDALWLVVGGLTLLGLGVIVVQRHRLALWLAAWALLPLAVFTPTWTPVYPHYFIASLPAFALLAGIGATFIIEKVGMRHASSLRMLIGVPVVLGILGIILITQGLWWRGLLNYVDTRETLNGFGTPLHDLLRVRDRLAGQTDVIVISDGLDVLYDQEPAIWSVLLRRRARCVRTLTGSGVAVFPDQPFAVLTAPNAPENPVNNLYQTAAEIRLPLRKDEGFYRINRFERAPVWSGPALTPITPARFGNGAQLTGYRLDQTTLYLEWQLPGRVSEDYHYFGHFLGANGEKRGQRDNLLWPGRFWCADDRLITWIDIQLPEETTTLRVGLYTLDNGRFNNTPVLDGVGSPAGVWVDISLTAR